MNKYKETLPIKLVKGHYFENKKLKTSIFKKQYVSKKKLQVYQQLLTGILSLNHTGVGMKILILKERNRLNF